MSASEEEDSDDELATVENPRCYMLPSTVNFGYHK